MLNEFLFTKIEEKATFGCAKYHIAEATVDVWCPVFDDRIISRKVDVVWSPRTCDLAPLACYLYGAVKDKCYADKP